jgi:hypothetical protein
MRFAYADPPYLGKCGKFYGHYHPDGLCWDDLATHELLIGRLAAEYPDGWALSCSSPDLFVLPPLCPPGTRIGAWVKPFCAFKKGVRPAFAWEPVLYWGGRNSNHPPPPKGGEQTTPKDYIAAPITMRRGLTGAKPAEFCRWVLDLLGYVNGDEVADLFPGTGVMGRVAAQGTLQVAAPVPAVPVVPGLLFADAGEPARDGAA